MNAGAILLTAGELTELLYLRECGFTQRDLARCFHIHQTTVSKYLRTAGDPLDPTELERRRRPILARRRLKHQEKTTCC